MNRQVKLGILQLKLITNYWKSRSQVYHPSSISTRGGPMELHSAPLTAEGHNYENDDDQTIQGLVTRPSTNQTITKFDSYKLSTNSNYVPITSFFDRFNSNSQSTSYSLNQRINRLIKSERKMMKQKQELIKDINCWCNILPNDDCKKLLYHFIKILETELETNELSIKKKEQINVQLLNVNKRERRTNDLKLKRNKMLVKLRESENKVGDSPLTTLTKENLEELECSVEIVEDQFIRSINNGLKNSIVDYVSNLKDSSSKYKENSEYFLENYFFSSTKLNANSNLQRVILQNKLNSAIPPSSSSAMLTRSTSQENFNSAKYVAISPNQVGKYLDNRFDTENNKVNTEDRDPVLLPIPNNEGHDNPTNINNQSKEFLSEAGMKHGPPPTPELHKHVRPSHEVIDANFIINSYSTPGSLALRPNSQLGNHNHEWG